MSFQDDSTSAVTPLLTKYNVSSVVISPQGGTAFTVSAPVPPPPPSPTFQIGWNLGGLWATNSRIDDTGFNIQQLLLDMAPLGNGRIIRAWGTCPLVGTIPDSQFTQTRVQAAAGLKVIYVWNTQNNGGNIPTQAQVTAHFNSWPTAANSGVWACELVNEHDNSQYLNQTSTSVAELAMLFMTAGPILKSKGYVVIGSNALSSFGYYQDGSMKPALKPQYIDYIGRHGYANTSAIAIANEAKVKAYGDGLGLGYCCTEAGLREANYVVELPKYWTAKKVMGGIHVGFTLYQISTSPTYGYQSQPYNIPNQTNAIYAAIKPVLGAA